MIDSFIHVWLSWTKHSSLHLIECSFETWNECAWSKLSEDSEKKIAANGLDKKPRIQSSIKHRVSSLILFPSRVLRPENLNRSLAQTEVEEKHSSSDFRSAKRVF